MSRALRAVRGATTIDEDTAEQVTERVGELLEGIFEANDVGGEDLVSLIFTVTDDVTAMYPATAARAWGLDDVPLLGAREMSVPGSPPRCIRVLVHLHTDRPRSEIRHVYQHGAVSLRPDLGS